MTKRIAFLTVVFFQLLIACDGPGQKEVDRAFNKYIDTAVTFSDTITYTIRGDSLVLHFPHQPKINVWLIAYHLDSFYTYKIGPKKEVVIVNEEVRTLTDTTSFVIRTMPFADYSLLMYDSCKEIVQNWYWSRPGGKLVPPRKNSAYSVDYRLYTEIKDEKLRKAVIDKLNELNGFYSHTGRAFPYELESQDTAAAK